MGSIFEFRGCYLHCWDFYKDEEPGRGIASEPPSFIFVASPNTEVEFKSGNRTLRA